MPCLMSLGCEGQRFLTASSCFGARWLRVESRGARVYQWVLCQTRVKHPLAGSPASLGLPRVERTEAQRLFSVGASLLLR